MRAIPAGKEHLGEEPHHDIQGTKRREKINWASCFSFGGKSEKREIEEYLRTKNNQFPG
jgi:hypothetical protein